MAFNLVNLDSATRGLMLEEIDNDIKTGKLFISSRLNTTGKQAYPALLKEASEKYDDSWLTAQLRAGNRFNPTEQRTLKDKVITAKMNEKAPDMLAEGEFNRFYLRGLCLRAIRDNIPNLIIYRAKHVSNPSSESEAKIGTSISPQALLNDLRSNIGIDTAFGVPRGPNSGLSAKMP
jgi:hypothetical protein